jgi:hypothetical protein
VGPYIRMDVSLFVSVLDEFSSFAMCALSDESILTTAITSNQFSAFLDLFVSDEIDRESNASEYTVHLLGAVLTGGVDVAEVGR